ncbi:MAG TPA: hypothetical protein VNL17_16590 [Verrucomicrobiae bacterium]|nr:hypothetical protein [Verrucomicrobiae bacterium]
MFGDKTDPHELAFWKNRLADRSILSALTTYPEIAKSIFGPVPVMRADVLQLGIILGAREILARPPGHLAFDMNDMIDEEMRAEIDTQPAEVRALFIDMLNPEKQDKSARETARRIIQAATGEMPSGS